MRSTVNLPGFSVMLGVFISSLRTQKRQRWKTVKMEEKQHDGVLVKIKLRHAVKRE